MINLTKSRQSSGGVVPSRVSLDEATTAAQEGAGQRGDVGFAEFVDSLATPYEVGQLEADRVKQPAEKMFAEKQK
jgi:hypothetical protein